MALKHFRFSTICVFSPFYLFFPKFRRYSQRSYNSKNHLIRANSQTPRGFELPEFNCICKRKKKSLYSKRCLFSDEFKLKYCLIRTFDKLSYFLQSLGGSSYQELTEKTLNERTR